jgi:hypothetical protein
LKLPFKILCDHNVFRTFYLNIWESQISYIQLFLFLPFHFGIILEVPKIVRME